MKRIILMLCLVLLLVETTSAQMNYGMTGLMNLPTAEMQRDKTFMAGGSWLNHHGTVPRWWYDTWNYYINITIFPWLEVGYLLMGHKAVEVDYGNSTGYWVPRTYGRFINQDRSFHVRLRLWKEGWWKVWTPQVVIGSNDIFTESWSGTSLTSSASTTNGYQNRYFLAVTKHFDFEGVGQLGAHVVWIYSNRYDNDLNDPGAGVNFRFGLKDKDKLWRKMVNGITLMAEAVPGYTDVDDNKVYDESASKYQVNVGLMYTCWKDHINALFELTRCQYPSVTLQLKLHLK